MLIKCQCKDCLFFSDIEGEGWENTNNGFHIVYCKDAKTRAVVLEEGCCDYEEKGYIQ
jgi:hypothetical protein